MNLQFAPRVEDDLADAAGFYEARSAGLGEDFLVAVRRAADELLSAPERWSAQVRRRSADLTPQPPSP